MQERARTARSRSSRSTSLRGDGNATAGDSHGVNRPQERGQRGPKVYSLHAPEVECIGKGKPHKPYEFGVKVSVATTLKRCKGGQLTCAPIR
jgi:hypothetical protein